MSFQAPLTIKKALERIDKRELLLPAIQREFVWSADDIELLFDSLMCDFPINSFLFWKVDNAENKNQYKYYQFLTKYIEYYHETADSFNTNGVNDFCAVLDGQQRLTALYLGLKGSYAYKKPYAHWDNLDNYPERKLYLDICKKYKEYTEEEHKNIAEYDDEREYGFYFLTEQEFNNLGGSSRFFKVGDILTEKYKDVSCLIKTLEEQFSNNKFAHDTIAKLYDIIYNKPLINYYLEETEDYDKALKIFIRTNSGGEKLSFSDLLISTIISTWTSVDARTEFNNLEKEIKNMGFYNFSKEFIVRCALLAYSKDIKFKVNNLSSECLFQFEKEWNSEGGLKATIKEAFTLLKNYGHNDNTITSYNAIALIVYYLNHTGKTKQFCDKVAYKQDRLIILKWLNIVFLKKIFGGQSDSILKEIRDVIQKSRSHNFPVEEIKEKLEGTRKSLKVDNEFIESLLFEQKESRYAFPILSLLYDGSDYRTTKHKDHLHPEYCFSKKELKKLNLSEDDLKFYQDKNNWNSILNLQLLYGNDNEAKNKKSLEEWIEKNNINCKEQLIPSKFVDIKDFRKFIEERKKILTQRLLKAFE